MSVITPMWSVIISIGMLFGIGGSVVLAIARAKERRAEQRVFYVHTGSFP